MKKYKNIIFVALINIIFFFAAFILIGNVYSIEYVNGQAKITPSEFLNLSPSRLIGLNIWNYIGSTLSNGTWDTSGDAYIYKQAHDLGQTGCFHHMSDGAISTTISSIYDIDFDSISRVMRISSYMSGSSKTKRANGIDTSVGILIANAYKSGNIDNLRKALLRAMNAGTVVYDNRIFSSSNWDNGSKIDSDEANLYNNYKKLTKVSGTTPTETSSVVNIKGENYSIIGPFKMSFDGKKIQSVTVYNTSWREDTKMNIYWSNSYSTRESDWSVEFNNGSEPEQKLNNKIFYLAVKSSKLPTQTTSYNVIIQQEQFTYRHARIAFCGGKTDVGQQYGIYYYGSPKIIKGAASWSLKHVANGKITIEKVDKENTTKKVQGVQLKLYGETNAGNGWVKSNKALSSSYYDAATFTTLSNGKVTIDDIPRGTYYIYEIGTASGYSLDEQRKDYPDYKDPKKFAGKSNYGNAVYLTSVGLAGESAEITGIKQAPQKGKITVKKINQNNSQGISGVKLKVYGVTSAGGKGWLKSNGSLTSSFSSAYTYTTSGYGTVTISELEKGTYYIYETRAASGYDIEDQRVLYPNSKDPNGFAGQSQYGRCVYLATASSNHDFITLASFKQKPQIVRSAGIGKTDLDTKEGIANAGFTVLQRLSRDYLQDETQFNAGEFVWLRSDGSITSSFSEAYEFRTDSSGNFSIDNITTYGRCYIYETSAGNGYRLREQESGYKIGKPSAYTGNFFSEWVYIGYKDITTNAGTTIKQDVTNEHLLGDLVIEKKDATYQSDLQVTDEVYLSGAKFKLYGTTKHGKTGWVRRSTIRGNTKFTVGTYQEATEFTTDANGKINIYDLEFGKYYIYETKGASGYNLKEQPGYHQSMTGSSSLGSSDWVYMGEVVHSYNNGQTTYIELENTKYISIKGKVWLDEPDTKGNATDNLYKSSTNDKVLSGIQVNLYNKKTGGLIATTTTNSNGEYTFSKKSSGQKITYWEASYYYIEFTYDNTKYITVMPFQGEKESISANSKAQEDEISGAKLDDSYLTGTSGSNPGKAYTYKGASNNQNKTTIAQNASESLNKRILCGYYNNSTYTIENINLGLIEKFTPDHTIGEELEYVKIKKGNYTFKYKYGDEAVTEQGNQQSSVMLQNSKKTFTQSIYPSDVKYNIANGLNSSSNEGFKIYVVYKITVKNNTAENVEPIYVEKTLNLTSLTNTYDTSRYELANEAIDDNENINSDFRNWSDSSGIATYNLRDTSKKFKDGITSGDQESVYIEFKVKDEALTKLLTDNQLAESPTKAKSTGYHIYERKDNSWNASKINTHISITETRENGSLYLAWKLYGTRTISGTVFEDTKIASRENERIGDGKFDQGTEKTLTDVIVSLMNAENTTYNGSKDQEAYLYEDDLIQNPATGKWTRCKQKAVTKVDANGNYSFKGVIPGKYYLKFTYGDGRTSITDLNGNAMNVATKIKGQSTTINSNYYKSTILTGAAQNEGNSKWFLTGISEGVNSVATDSKITYYDENGNLKAASSDIINARTTSNKEINNTSSKTKAVIDATSPTMDIDFEYLSNIEYQVTNNQLLDLKTNCTGMCFGIIERPHTEITLNKEIKNVKLTLSNGTSLINGNPMNANVSPYLTGITASDSKVETDYTNLYGSTLTIDYSVKVTNESELDYATKEYYTKGTIGRAAPVTTTVTKIIDYVSYKAASYQETSDNLHYANEYTNSEGYTKADYYENNIIETNEREYKNQLLITNVENLTPKKAGRGTYESNYVVSVSKLLPSSETTEDLGMKSYSEIIGITNITFTPQYTNHMGSYIAGDSTSRRDGGTSEADNAGSTITLTPPTGKNKDYTVYIVVATMLGVIGIGILIIKKIVL